ncbi:hypothetical protein, partial [Flavobacterium sandaracinum]
PLFFIFSYQSLKELCAFAGCKGNIRFLISQAFLNVFRKKIFYLNLMCLPVFKRTFAVVAGAKLTPLLGYSSFFKLFFYPFLNFNFNSLKP